MRKKAGKEGMFRRIRDRRRRKDKEGEKGRDRDEGIRREGKGMC